MKTVVVYYSFKGNSKFVADVASQRLKAEEVRLVPDQEPPKKGLGMFLKGGGMALKKQTPELVDFSLDVSGYDTIVLCAPVWAGVYPPAVGSFLSKVDLSGKNLAVIACSASGKAEKMIGAIEGATKAKLVAKLSLLNPLRSQEDCKAKIQAFCDGLV